MPSAVTVKTPKDFAQAIGPHLSHEVYRCDKPYDRLMGKGCKTCGVEHYISIADFREHGDLEVFEAELKPFGGGKKKK
ncbi:MAG: hypothetical protein ACOZIN_09400 [Myxococcota bacterium]